MSDNGTDRIPPRDQRAEGAVIGACLRDNSVIGDVFDIVVAGDFYAFAHQKIFEAVTTLSLDKGQPADCVTLANYLKEKKLIDEVGGYVYLTELWDASPSPAS